MNPKSKIQKLTAEQESRFPEFIFADTLTLTFLVFVLCLLLAEEFLARRNSRHHRVMRDVVND